MPPVPAVLPDWPSPAEEPPVLTELLDVPPLRRGTPCRASTRSPNLIQPMTRRNLTVLLDVPPPADEPPVPTVEEVPDGQLVPRAVAAREELPPVPTVLLTCTTASGRTAWPGSCLKFEQMRCRRRGPLRAMLVTLNMVFPPSGFAFSARFCRSVLFNKLGLVLLFRMGDLSRMHHRT